MKIPFFMGEMMVSKLGISQSQQEAFTMKLTKAIAAAGLALVASSSLALAQSAEPTPPAPPAPNPTLGAALPTGVASNFVIFGPILGLAGVVAGVAAGGGSTTGTTPSTN